ncbi:IMP dehydrogenase [Arcanobacterium hippocoleae]|uniref:IMP dehydrogenase n=1 Tax=Arcanobacterium hippocoleae TaxID=149017 RepID=UPI00334257A0
MNDLKPSFDLTYDDVFMVPSYSNVGSRNNVDLKTADGTGTTIPLVVANMTAIAGKRMAETVARRGGLVVIPQDIPVDVVIETVRKVKSRHLVYETPVVLKPHHTCGYGLTLLPKRAHKAAVVIDPESNIPLGMVAESDLTGVDRFTQLREVMSTKLITIAEGTAPRDAFIQLKEAHLNFAPVVDAQGSSLACIRVRARCVRRFIRQQLMPIISYGLARQSG